MLQKQRCKRCFFSSDTLVVTSENKRFSPIQFVVFVVVNESRSVHSTRGMTRNIFLFSFGLKLFYIKNLVVLEGRKKTFSKPPPSLPGGENSVP